MQGLVLVQLFGIHPLTSVGILYADVGVQFWLAGLKRIPCSQACNGPHGHACMECAGSDNYRCRSHHAAACAVSCCQQVRGAPGGRVGVGLHADGIVVAALRAVVRHMDGGGRRQVAALGRDVGDMDLVGGVGHGGDEPLRDVGAVGADELGLCCYWHLHSSILWRAHEAPTCA